MQLHCWTLKVGLLLNRIEKDQIGVQSKVLEEGDTELLTAAAIGNLSKGMGEIVQKTKLNRQSLYKSLSQKGSPKFETVLKILQAFNLKLTVKSAI